ncbi:hypothetical protein SDC9_108485 [bioreactor metagenome]|uniref:Uncharacterized protein n=1 Tax=bioreactor metagenome TaxID=1076179 RepID=A0A645B886_9ZZZZ
MIYTTYILFLSPLVLQSLSFTLDSVNFSYYYNILQTYNSIILLLLYIATFFNQLSFPNLMLPTILHVKLFIIINLKASYPHNDMMLFIDSLYCLRIQF